MKRRIGLLICGHIPDEIAVEHGHYTDLYRALLGGEAFDYRDYFVVDGQFPEKIDECDGYLISGSAHGAYEDHDFIEPLKKLIRSVHERKMPMVGICFGHQIMALALGGKVEKFSGGWGLGPHSYDIDLGEGQKPFSLQAVHQDQVTEIPENTEIFGSSAFCRFAALSYGNNAISMQPHPEFTQEFMQDLIEFRRGQSFPEPIVIDSLQRMEETPDRHTIAQKIVTILRG